jgi:hypothetical protein
MDISAGSGPPVLAVDTQSGGIFLINSITCAQFALQLISHVICSNRERANGLAHLMNDERRIHSGGFMRGVMLFVAGLIAGLAIHAVMAQTGDGGVVNDESRWNQCVEYRRGDNVLRAENGVP